jgi:hypothetical protein
MRWQVVRKRKFVQQSHTAHTNENAAITRAKGVTAQRLLGKVYELSCALFCAAVVLVFGRQLLGSDEIQKRE